MGQDTCGELPHVAAAGRYSVVLLGVQSGLGSDKPSSAQFRGTFGPSLVEAHFTSIVLCRVC